MSEADVHTRLPTAPAPNPALFGVLLCLPSAPALPIRLSGTSARRRFLGSSGKQSA